MYTAYTLTDGFEIIRQGNLYYCEYWRLGFSALEIMMALPPDDLTKLILSIPISNSFINPENLIIAMQEFNPSKTDKPQKGDSFIGISTSLKSGGKLHWFSPRINSIEPRTRS